MRKKVLITGAFGFVGSNLAAHLAGQGYELWALDVGSAAGDAGLSVPPGGSGLNRTFGAGLRRPVGAGLNAADAAGLRGAAHGAKGLDGDGYCDHKVVAMTRLKGCWFGLRAGSRSTGSEEKHSGGYALAEQLKEQQAESSGCITGEAILNLKPSNQARSAGSNQQHSCGSNEAVRPAQTSPAGAAQTSGDSRGAYERVFTWEQLEEIPWCEVGAVVHLAGKAHDTKSTSDPQSYFDVNVGLTKRVLEAFGEVRECASARVREEGDGLRGASHGTKGLGDDGYCDHKVVAIRSVKGQQACSSGCAANGATVNFKPSNQQRSCGLNQAVRPSKTSTGGAAQTRRAAPAQTFILFSSVKAVADSVAGVLTEEAVPQPQTPYGRSKLEAEGLLQPRSGCNAEVKRGSERQASEGREAVQPPDGRTDEVKRGSERRAVEGSEAVQPPDGRSDEGKRERGRQSVEGRGVLNTHLQPLGGCKDGGCKNGGSQMRTYILRPCMIHGPGNKGNLNLLHSVVSRGVPWPLGAFENRRSFASIGNVCAVVEGLISGEVESGVYQVADDEALSTNEVIRMIAESQGRRPRLWRIPAGVVAWMARVGDWLHLPLNSERLKKLTESYVVSNAKLKRALGWERMPVGAKEGMRRTLERFSR